MKKGILLAIGSYIAWGVLSIFWKYLGKIDSYEVFSYRILFTMLTMLIYFLACGKTAKLKTELTTLGHNKRECISMVLASIFLSINWIVYIYAMANHQATAASLGYYINPLFSVFLAVILLKETLTSAMKLAIVLALSGVVILAIQAGQLPIVSLLLPLTFGTYGVIKKNVNLSSDVAMFFEMLVVSPVVLSFLIFFAKHQLTDYSLLDQGMLALSGIITALPFLLFAEALKLAPLNVVGFAQYLNPTIKLAIAIFLFHEPFKVENLYGFVAIWISILVFMIGQIILLKKMRNVIK
ncbi:EamA family transporter RarD [Pseudolactococcus plantarum]|uniref:EamA domain-containing protein n=1 Tax=Pseudolactococcus plantarum TaxID=1365 RepID=A0A2A5RYA7_9LACT|nr:EamA family transporter RarD [Lactococcus plantarum]PCS06237.1 hypothetical protein RU87_GL001758 [Lactococcus plantarum]HCN74765.1 EamA family transporter RarD [Lactococcus sp.]